MSNQNRLESGFPVVHTVTGNSDTTADSAATTFIASIPNIKVLCSNMWNDVGAGTFNRSITYVIMNEPFYIA